MRPDDPTYEYLLLIADALGDLRENQRSSADLRRVSC